MPTISDPNLTLSEADGRVTIRVRYEVTFDDFDRALAELGRNWHSHVNVHGFDGGDELGADIPEAVFDRVDFNVRGQGQGGLTHWLPETTIVGPRRISRSAPAVSGCWGAVVGTGAATGTQIVTS